MFCRNCGTKLEDGAAFCTKCGTQQKRDNSRFDSFDENFGATSNQTPTEKGPQNAICVLGLVISCISLFLNFWGLVGIAGTIVSVIGLTSSSQKKERGATLAIIGIGIGAFSIIYAMVSISAL